MMKIIIYTLVVFVILYVVMFISLAIKSATPPKEIGLLNGRLRQCPDAPNCVCSEQDDPPWHIEPFGFTGDPAAAWKNVMEKVAQTGGTIKKNTGEYLWATYRSHLWHFIDDFELRLDSAAHTIHVRSVARVGKGDLGVNRKRVEHIRSLLGAR